MAEKNGEEWEKMEGDQWNPSNEGDFLVGVVKQLVQGNYGKQLRILTKNDEEFLTPPHKILQSCISDVKEGDVIKIVFTGTKPSKQGSPTRKYDVFRRK